MLVSPKWRNLITAHQTEQAFSKLFAFCPKFNRPFIGHSPHSRDNDTNKQAIVENRREPTVLRRSIVSPRDAKAEPALLADRVKRAGP
jgi:hypothetical protein